TMDNGSPWGDTTGSRTAVALWLMRLGIRGGHSRPYHPQTQGNLERPHEALEMAVPASRYQPSSRQHSARVA
ncbi:MAG: transposase family protein, partial [Pantoea sp. Pent]|nr:transposase family protein [Pantoea sp. Pent]